MSTNSRRLRHLSLLALFLCNTACGQEPSTTTPPPRDLAATAAPQDATNPVAQFELGAKIEPAEFNNNPNLTTPVDEPDTAPATSIQATANASSHLSHKLLVQSLVAQPNENAVISGYSFAQALQLARHAARGRSRDQIEKALWGVVDTERGLENLESSTSAAQFHSANAIFLARELRLNPSYKPEANTIEQVDFKSSSALGKLNQWFTDATEGNITKMFEFLSPDSQFVLANALFFKGTWRTAFDPAKTKVGPFAGSQEASYMHTRLTLDYAELSDGKALRLPLKGSLNLWLVLPSETPAEWLHNNPDLLSGYLNTRSSDVTLSLPRFDVSGGGDVTSYAKPLGLAALFTQCADFTAMTDDPLQLGQIVHRATLKIDEIGAEGSAATAITGVRSASIAPSIELSFDRPFIAVVVDSREDQTPILAAVIQKVQP